MAAINSRKQIALCRLSFLLVCIVPTTAQVWSVLVRSPDATDASQLRSTRVPNFDESVAQPDAGPARSRTRPSTPVGSSANSPAAADPSNEVSSQGQVANVAPALSNPDADRFGLINFPWLSRQGVSPDTRLVGARFNVLVEELPQRHPLRSLPGKEFTISETGSEVVIQTGEIHGTLSGLQSLARQWWAGHFDGLSENIDRVHLETPRLVLQSESSVTAWEIDLRDIRVVGESRQSGVDLAGRIVVNDGANQPIEIPFTGKLSRPGADSEGRAAEGLDLTVHRFPAGILGESWRVALGSTAEFSGNLRVTSLADGNTVVNLQGRFVGVSNESLTTWLNPRREPLADGTCEINCQNLIVDPLGLQSFTGVIQGPSSGTATARLVELIGAPVQWTAASPVSVYRSFLFQVRYQRGAGGLPEWQVSSNYEGGQLMWTADGSGILVIPR